MVGGGGGGGGEGHGTRGTREVNLKTWHGSSIVSQF